MTNDKLIRMKISIDDLENKLNKLKEEFDTELKAQADGKREELISCINWFIDHNLRLSIDSEDDEDPYAYIKSFNYNVDYHFM